jgi:hypothetical protein
MLKARVGFICTNYFYFKNPENEANLFFSRFNNEAEFIDMGALLTVFNKNELFRYFRG